VTTPPTARRLADASADAAASLAAGAIARGLIDAEEATYRRRLQQLAEQHRCGADCADLHRRRRLDVTHEAPTEVNRTS
jgi:hypothetical protein